MRSQQRARFSFPFGLAIWKCAVALICCAFSIEPLFAQEVDWPYYGHDLSNQRYADLDQINPSNVSELTAAWTFHTGYLSDPNMSMEMTPLVVDGQMYITTGDDDVFALNPATGKQVWHYHPSDMPAISTLPVCCNNDNRGVAYGNGMVFNARLDGKLVALNAKTGAVVWSTVVDTAANGAGMTLAPQYISASTGTVPEVLVGVTGGEFGVRGHLDAYSPSSGKLLWRFYTTDPDTWAGTSWQHGGASIWGTPTFDPTLNMVYFATGNAFPWPWAGNRAGANLFATSIVAVDATAGTLQWFFQWAHHDQWDFDGPQPTVLLTYDGVPALEHTSKTGYMWILDRASGEPLIPYQEVAVPPASATASFQNSWPTQPESSIQSLTPHLATGLPAGTVAAPMWATTTTTPQVFQPWASGGMEWPPAAYSPRTNMIYSHARYNPADVGTTNDAATNYACPGGNLGVKHVATCGFIFKAVPGVNHGVYGAVNLTTGTVAWQVPILTTSPNSGVTVAGDLAFFGDDTGIFYAVNAATGEILWVFDSNTVANAPGATASAAVYEINGVEYVVYGFGGEPGESFELGDAVIAFALPSAVAAAAKAAAGRAKVK
jgi:PQQ-dependent dehydrogenase (methanol/ethanol family)